MSAVKPNWPMLRRGHPLAQGLVLGLPVFEGSGATANDLSGYSDNGVLTGGVTWVGGPSGWALKLDGTSGYISIPSSPSLPDGSAPFSVACWVAPTLAS